MRGLQPDEPKANQNVKLINAVCDKVGQMTPGIMNVLAIRAESDGDEWAHALMRHRRARGVPLVCEGCLQAARTTKAGPYDRTPGYAPFLKPGNSASAGAPR